VYPQTGLPVVVEIAPGAAPATDPGTWTWTDVTASALTDQISITAGRGDWGDHVDPGTCSLTFLNTSGDFSEHNPAGQWYGSLGRDTPLRVRLRRAEDAFGRTASNGWGTSDSGQVWTTAGGSTSDYSVASGFGQHSHTTVNVLRATLLGVSLRDCEQIRDVQTSALLTGAALVTGSLFRYQDSSNYYWLRTELNAGGTSVQLKITKRVAGVETQIANLNPVPALAYAASTPLRTRAQVVGNTLAMKVWRASDPEPVGWSLTATDEDLTTAGKTGEMTWLVGGNTNTLPVTASVDSYKLFVDLAGGFVPAWVPRWDLSGKVRTVPVTASGVLYRLQPGQSSPPVRSALRRALHSSSPLAYWPLEDGEDSTQAASGIPGGTPLTVDRDVMDFIDTGPVGSDGAAAPHVSADNSLSGPIVGGSSTAWQMSCWSRGVATGVPPVDPYYISFEVRTSSGKILRLGFQDQSDVAFIAEYNSESQTTTTNFFSQTYTAMGSRYVIDGQWHLLQAAFTQSGADTDVEFWFDDVFASAGTWFGVTIGAPITASAIGRFGGGLGTISQDMQEINIAHLAVHNGAAVVDQYQAGLGYPGEAASDRIVRLCTEEGIPVEVAAGGSESMGPQPAATFPDLLRDCEDSDGGVLSERTFTLAYRPSDAYYNQPATLTLSAADLADAPEPDGTGQRYRNRWTVSRNRGSSVVAETDGVAAGTDLAYEASADVNVATDARLPDQAGWRLHVTTSTELRWPRLALNLAARPSLIDQWLSCRIGSRITVSAPPADVAGQDIDVLLEGYTLTLGYKDFDVDANCSPARPWDVATINGRPRVAAKGSTVGTGGLTSGGTTFLLTSTVGNGVWTVDAAAFPLEVLVGGEQVTLSSITGTSSPQTANVSARTVARAWPAGTEVNVRYPAVVAL
jgi:hypothetical protein